MEHIWLDDQDGLIITGDVLAGLECLDDNSMEAIVTDPPYDLLQASRGGSGRSNNPDNPAGRHGTKTGGFMGMAWDATGVAFDPKTWEACLRVLKPGGHLLAFGGTRTHHRMWCAIEDAGFEVRDMVVWLYGQGFPKSLSIGKAIDKAAGVEREVTGPATHIHSRGKNQAFPKRPGETTVEESGRTAAQDVPVLTAPATDEAKQWEGWGTALKPACEPILLARKPLSEKSVAANVLKWGTGALNIDGTRIGTKQRTYKGSGSSQQRYSDSGAGLTDGRGKDLEFTATGRWPANVMLQCICDDPESVPERAREREGEPLQERRYTEEGATNIAATPGVRREGGGFVHEPDCPAGLLDEQTAYLKNGDSGGASRFFYCAKASKKERGEANKHPTVKPLALMRWLVQLVTPPEGYVLDPFCGSGSTLVAAVEDGHGFVGIDLSPEYCATAQQRIEALE